MATLKWTISQAIVNLRYALNDVCNTEPATPERLTTLDHFEICMLELIQATINEVAYADDQRREYAHQSIIERLALLKKDN